MAEVKTQKSKLSKKEELLLEQRRLEKLVVGKKHGLFDTFSNKSPSDTEAHEDEFLESKASVKEPVWKDDDDEEPEIPHKLLKYSTGKSEDSYHALLRRKFKQTMGSPSWATKKPVKESADSEDEDIKETMRCGKMLSQHSKSLPRGQIKIDRMTDLNKETRYEGPLINAVEFHPTSTVALVAGVSGLVSLFQVGGLTNGKLQTIKFKKFRVSCARFSSDGEQFLVGAKHRRTFLYYDMMEGRSVEVPVHHAIGEIDMSKFEVSPDGKHIAVCGKHGNIHLLNARTKEWITDLKMNSLVADLTFSSDGSRMYSYGNDGEIFEWDMNTRSCTLKMLDEGCLRGISIALSSNNQILATGSSAGVVNLYEMPVKDGQLKPVKVVSNLVTPVTSLRFNSTSEILAIGSNEKDSAVKLVHFPSMTVFSNFPTTDSISLARVLSFSPSSGYFAVGNDRRNVLLYRLKHYKNY